jgi:hypothetical protein
VSTPGQKLEFHFTTQSRVKLIFTREACQKCWELEPLLSAIMLHLYHETPFAYPHQGVLVQGFEGLSFVEACKSGQVQVASRCAPVFNLRTTTLQKVLVVPRWARI